MIWNKLQNTTPPLYLLIVVESTGSAPGRVGFKMLVCQDGSLHGSIGGGIMEYNMVELAKEQLAQKKYNIFTKKQIHRQGELDSSGMICSGEQTIAFLPILDKSIIPTKQLNKGKALLIQYSNQGIKLFPHDKNNTPAPFQSSANTWSYCEPLNTQKIIYIIGGGHVGAATSHIFHFLGFHVVILDNRPALNTLENNPYPHESKVINYDQILDYIPVNPNIHIAIMTTKFTEDQLLLEQLAHRNYRYIGVLGSKTKITKMFTNLRKKGISDTFLNSLHAPIGLKIGSQTPEEIAVSIAGEVVGSGQSSVSSLQPSVRRL